MRVIFTKETLCVAWLLYILSAQATSRRCKKTHEQNSDKLLPNFHAAPVLSQQRLLALTYINYWTEHSSNDSSAEVHGAAVTYYVPSWAAPCPIFICSLHLEQSRVDSCTALSTLRPQIAMVWSNCLFVVEI